MIQLGNYWLYAMFQHNLKLRDLHCIFSGTIWLFINYWLMQVLYLFLYLNITIFTISINLINVHFIWENIYIWNKIRKLNDYFELILPKQFSWLFYWCILIAILCPNLCYTLFYPELLFLTCSYLFLNPPQA